MHGKLPAASNMKRRGRFSTSTASSTTISPYNDFVERGIQEMFDKKTDCLISFIARDSGDGEVKAVLAA